MADLFGNALAYEELMGRWSVRLAPLFANFARITDGGRVLDVGCGTGSLVRTVAGMAHQSEIVGIDPAQPFIEYARTRCADSRITFAVAMPWTCPIRQLRSGTLFRSSCSCLSHNLKKRRRRCVG